MGQGDKGTRGWGDRGKSEKGKVKNEKGKVKSEKMKSEPGQE